MPVGTKLHVPVYRHHKPSGLASVRLDGRDVYLGPHGTPESREQYKRVITEWLANHKEAPSVTAGDRATRDRTVDELLAAYLDFAKTYYVKNGAIIEPMPHRIRGGALLLRRAMEPSGSAQTLATLKQSFTSIVSYPDRVAAWGDARYRGNCDGRLFLSLVLRYGPRRVADPMLGSGTTRDVIDWLNQRSTERVEFWGSDLRKGFNLWTNDLPGTFDLVWIHPPYWNIIRYSDCGEDLSNIDDYGHFRQALRVCLQRCYAALAPGGRLAVLVGDVRRKGQYFPIVRDVLNLEGELGELRAVIIKAQHHCKSDSVNYARMEDPRIQHEYCVLFKKSLASEAGRAAA